MFWLWVMCVILILIHSIAILIIGPSTAMSSELLRSMATASASIAICLISLKIGFAIIAILSSFVEMRLSDSNNFETDVDYTEVFGLCFFV